jgi:ATP-dependent DNA ligase
MSAVISDNYSYRSRCLSFIEDGRLRLQNRHLIDISDRYPELACLRELPAGTVIDGEIVVLEHGRPSFQKLQQRDHLRDPTRIEILSKRMPVTLMAFDLLYVRGRRITGQPLTERRQPNAGFEVFARNALTIWSSWA